MSRCEKNHESCSVWHEPCYWCPDDEKLISGWKFYDEKTGEMHSAEVMSVDAVVDETDRTKDIRTHIFRAKR
jgi:hypothetical protein